jgi:hypothetical protein
MSKINKDANLYDKDGNLLRKAPLTDVTIEEAEQMLDALKGHEDTPEYNNLMFYLMELYRKYGNPHKKDIIDKINEAYAKRNNDDEVKEALEEVAESLDNAPDGAEVPEESKDEEQVQEDPTYDVNTLQTEDISYEPA